MLVPILLLVSDGGQRPSVMSPVHSGELIVLTRNGAACHFEDASGQYSGLETDMVNEFARQYGYRVRWIELSNVDQLVSQLVQQQAHIMAADLDLSAAEQRVLRAGPAYLPQAQVMVYNTDAIQPKNFSALLGKRLAVVAGTQHIDALNSARAHLPGLRWIAVSTAWEEQLLDSLSHGEFDAVLVDSASFALARHLYPNLDIAFTVGEEAPLAWQFPKNTSPVLWSQVQQFFKTIEQDGELDRWVERYYGYVDQLEDTDISGFLERMRTTLPKFRHIFYNAQIASGIDWRLLAAISYQESHWDPYATSPTGVRGMMMMTTDTADKMGVTDRLDAKQSILGGAMYLSELMALQPVRLEDPDRVWMALAAYNQGQGHVEDARVLAQHRHLNADAWCDVKQTLPLLSGNLHQYGAKHGYCRGGEAVIFVESIRTYYDILKKYEKPYTPSLEPPDMPGSGN
ncbi:MAG: membrane-bound lytic murein transglycosylase MltF [Betaproteobacteria bacterium]|nr:membrane-bound lytic murein transglycosylase MltF [Betaproteobacteria bacterium]